MFVKNRIFYLLVTIPKQVRSEYNLVNRLQNLVLNADMNSESNCHRTDVYNIRKIKKKQKETNISFSSMQKII